MLLDKDLVEDRLQNVPMPLVTAFASRCALRTVPFLALTPKTSPFSYWSESNKASHLLGVFFAQHFGLTSVAIGEESSPLAYSAYTKKIEDIYTDTVKTANRALTPDAVREIYTVAYVARSSSRAIYNTGKNSIEYTAKIIADACYAAKSAGSVVSKIFLSALTFDLDTITLKRDRRKRSRYLLPFTQKQTHSNIKVLSFLSAPLWENAVIPKEINVYWQRLQSWASSLDCGFGVWLQWYKERLDGHTIDPLLMRKMNEISGALIVQGPAVALYNSALKDLVRPPANIKLTAKAG